MAGRSQRDEDFAAYYVSRGASMRNTAYLLCGDWHMAEDLTQTAFIKLYQAWWRVSRRDTLDGYTRRVLVRTFLDEKRRPWRRERATPHGAVFDQLAHDPAVAEQVALRAALAAVPPRRRATLVCRFWLDLTHADLHSAAARRAGDQPRFPVLTGASTLGDRHARDPLRCLRFSP